MVEYINMSQCLYCHSDIVRKSYETPSDTKRRKFCNRSCATKLNNSLFPKKVKKIQVKKERQPSQMPFVTKKELFQRSKHYQSARNTIRVYAKRAYDKSDKPKCCAICQYTRCYEVSHLDSVASFPDDTTIGFINRLDNLVALCPTHHWEFDNGFLSKEDFGTACENRTRV